MTIEQFRDVLAANHFRPFTIRLANGTSVPVVRREFISQSPSGRTVVVFQADDRMSILDPLLVTKLTAISPSARGKRRKKK